MSKIAELDAQLQAICPMNGCVRFNDGTVRIDFKPEATAEQRATAQAIADAFDWRPRKPRTVAAVYQAVQRLTAADQSKLFAAFITLAIVDNPQRAKDVMTKLNIPIVEGDEL